VIQNQEEVEVQEGEDENQAGKVGYLYENIHRQRVLRRCNYPGKSGEVNQGEDE